MEAAELKQKLADLLQSTTIDQQTEKVHVDLSFNDYNEVYTTLLGLLDAVKIVGNALISDAVTEKEKFETGMALNSISFLSTEILDQGIFDFADYVRSEK